MVFDIISSVIDIALLYLYLNLFLSSPKKQLPKSLVFPVSYLSRLFYITRTDCLYRTKPWRNHCF